MSDDGEREHSTGNEYTTSVFQEVWNSSELLFSNKIAWLLLFGPLALFGDATKILGEPMCFAFSGIALIPCAERLSFVTEQVAEHTNGTIGALLNATFGNAPELLIATAALRSGFYRVVQLAMLGSMLTNLLFVFGLACLVGGLRWQVQELRITSGNVSVGMLLLAVAGSLLPAALILAGQLRTDDDENEDDSNIPSKEEIQFSRVNALVMIVMYTLYLTFQLGTHKEEFDDEENVVDSADGNQLHLAPHFTSRHGRQKNARKNMFCLELLSRLSRMGYQQAPQIFEDEFEMSLRNPLDRPGNDNDEEDNLSTNSDHSNTLLPQNETSHGTKGYFDEYNAPGRMLPLGLAEPPEPSPHFPRHAPVMSFRVGIVWLFIITLCISAMSDILVDTIDGFAQRLHISEVFTSMVIVPFFSNVAEQVSAVLFAYRNEMDLCVGVTVGSAIQVATFVLPGCVLIGMMVDRSMTLYFHAYETVCLFLAVIVVAAVLQGGTTNWLVGATLIGIYIMLATGFWFHELEALSVDAELIFHNQTSAD